MTKNNNIIKFILLLAVIYFIFSKIKQNKIENNDSFIKNTADDYDLPYCDVEAIYKKCGGDLISFYEKLEKRFTNKIK